MKEPVVLPRKVPTPSEINLARAAAGLTQQEAAEMVHLGSFKRWSEYERDITPMDSARWELFLIKTGTHQLYGPRQGVPVPRIAVDRDRG